jgi:hypothetical protein
MGEYEDVWRDRAGSKPAELFGFRFDVGLDPLSVNVERMIQAFGRGCRELNEVWAIALDTHTLGAISSLAHQAEIEPRLFHLSDDLWAKVILDFAVAYNKHPMSRGQLLQSLTPLYLARVASFVIETETLVASEVEDRIEQLCMTFENLKPYLIERWDEVPSAEPARMVTTEV